MQEITGINHIGIRVTDLDQSRAFYELFGFEFIIGPIGPEPVAIVKHPCGLELNFILNATDSDPTNVLMDRAEKHTGYTHMALDVKDLEAIRKKLAELEITITETMSLPNGAEMIFIRDPDGNVIELHKAGTDAQGPR